ncbi:hypothetical protein [Rhizobium sp. 9140]|uniref:hypothetical protein n=1 Tax=Rhizobium sp. 9140 TaxID=1761900 RepID=UPI001111DA45|nr:hypothetical protein [Rhizobium sp. 9140]
MAKSPSAMFNHGLPENGIPRVNLIGRRYSLSARLAKTEAERDTLLSRVERIDQLRKALALLENCCEQLVATRSDEIYTTVMDGG